MSNWVTANISKKEWEEKVRQFRTEYDGLLPHELWHGFQKMTRDIRSLWPHRDGKKEELLEKFCRRCAYAKNHRAIVATFPPSIQAGFVKFVNPDKR